MWKFCGKANFRIVSGDSPETILKLCLFTKFPHQEIRWNYRIFRSKKWSFPLRISSVNVTKYAVFCSLRIWSQLLKKFLMGNFTFCVVKPLISKKKSKSHRKLLKVGPWPSKKFILFASKPLKTFKTLKNVEKCFLFHLKSSFRSFLSQDTLKVLNFAGT